jgi:hypothetical protein
MGFLRLQKLAETVMKSDKLTGDDITKNADAFVNLVQCLDDRSLSLVIRDAKDDGRAALEILRGHYLSTGKPKIITLYTELTSLVKGRVGRKLRPITCSGRKLRRHI